MLSRKLLCWVKNYGKSDQFKLVRLNLQLTEKAILDQSCTLGKTYRENIQPSKYHYLFQINYFLHLLHFPWIQTGFLLPV